MSLTKSIPLLTFDWVSWVGQNEGMGWLKDISATLSPGQPLYVIFYALDSLLAGAPLFSLGVIFLSGSGT